MVRAAAKNHDFVTIVTDPADYTAVVAEMTEQQNAIGATLRRRLAMKAFGHTARSEEHTSELQSLMRISYAVFCLKKKKQQHIEKKQYSYIESTQNLQHTTD